MAWLARSLDTDFPEQFDNNFAAHIQLFQHVLQLVLHRLHVYSSNKQDTINGATTILVEVPAVEYWVTQLLSFTLVLHTANERWRGALQTIDAFLKR